MRAMRTPVAQGPLERTAGTEAGVGSEPPIPGVLGRRRFSSRRAGEGGIPSREDRLALEPRAKQKKD